jgi:hypothetical protein
MGKIEKIHDFDANQRRREAQGTSYSGGFQTN